MFETVNQNNRGQYILAAVMIVVGILVRVAQNLHWIPDPSFGSLFDQGRGC